MYEGPTDMESGVGMTVGVGGGLVGGAKRKNWHNCSKINNKIAIKRKITNYISYF